MFANTSTNKKQKIKGKKIKLTKDIVTGNRVIRDYLKRNEACEARIYLSCMHDLDLFLKKTDYFVFDWALKHENLILLNWLFEHIRPEHQLLMISHNDYASVKQFIQKNLSIDSADYNKEAASRQAILKLLLNVDPEAFANIQSEITHYAEVEASLCNQQTLIAFKQDLVNILTASTSAPASPFNLGNFSPSYSKNQ